MQVGLPEWSKGSRSGRDVFVRVGPNPTADILCFTFWHMNAVCARALQWYGKNTHVKPCLSAPWYVVGQMFCVVDVMWSADHNKS